MGWDPLNIEAIKPLLHDFVDQLSLMGHGLLNRLNKTTIDVTAHLQINVPPVEGKPADEP